MKRKVGTAVTHSGEAWTIESVHPADGSYTLRSLDGERITVVAQDEVQSAP